MNPRVNIYPESNNSGTSIPVLYAGEHDLSSQITNDNLIGSTFYIIHEADNGTTWAIDSTSSATSKVRLVINEWDKNNIDQVFTMSDNGTITNVGNGFVIDVSGASFADGTSVINYASNNTVAQLWTYNSDAQTFSVNSGSHVLNNHNYVLENDSELNIWSVNGHASQRWVPKMCSVTETFKPSLMTRARESFSKKKSRTESYTVTPGKKINLSKQKESFNTSRIICHTLSDSSGARTDAMDVGDYPLVEFSDTSDIGDFVNWVGKTFKISVTASPTYFVDTRDTQDNWVGSDSGGFGLWTAATSSTTYWNQLWTVNKNGMISPAFNGGCVATVDTTRPYLKRNINGCYDNERWTYNNGIISAVSNGYKWYVASTCANGVSIKSSSSSSTQFTLTEYTDDTGIEDFKYWVGKKFYIQPTADSSYYVDTRGTQDDGTGSDSRRIGLWTFTNLTARNNKTWTVDAYGHLGPASDPYYVLTGGSASPLLYDNVNTAYFSSRWRYQDGMISYIGSDPTWQISGSFTNGRYITKTSTRSATDYTTFKLVEAADVSTVVLSPYTDVILFQNENYSGIVRRLHNGKSSDYAWSLTNDNTDSYLSAKVRSGIMDGSTSTDTSDTSGTTSIEFKYRTHNANVGWSSYVTSGVQCGTIGQRLEAIDFHYSGPGQLYARAHVANYGWLDWVSSGVTCGTTGESRRMEAIQFKIEGADNVAVATSVYNDGSWNESVGLETTAGTTGQSLQLEAISIVPSVVTSTVTSDSGETIVVATEETSGWTITPTTDAGSTGSSVGSLQIAPLTDVVVPIYEDGTLVKTVTFHNGKSYSMVANDLGQDSNYYYINDTSVYGITTTDNITLSEATNDNIQSSTTEVVKESFTMVDSSGRITKFSIVILAILILLCIIAFFMYLHLRRKEIIKRGPETKTNKESYGEYLKRSINEL